MVNQILIAQELVRRGITVTDDEDPVITCAADQAQTADAGNCDAAITVIAPSATDNCSIDSVWNDINNTIFCCLVCLFVLRKPLIHLCTGNQAL